MPKFNSTEEAHAVHKDYSLDTDGEGKYDRNNKYCNQRNRIDFIVKAVPEDSYLLEVGCNSGGLLRLLSAERKCYCKGIDISDEMVARAKSKGYPVVMGGAEKLPWGNDIFDVVIMTEVMEHLYAPEIALAEIQRVLRPGGLFIGSVPHPKGHNAEKATTEEHKWHCHIFTEKGLRNMLSKYFTLTEMKDITHYNDILNLPQWIGWICKKNK